MDANKILEFMASNQLVINPSKTCILLNTRDSQKSLGKVRIGDEAVKIEDSGRLLGMEFSGNLTWGSHFDGLIKVLNQRISIIRRLREVIMTPQLISVGEALFNSKLRYGMAAYCTIRFTDSNPVNSDMQKLQVSQNSLMRLILGKRKVEHTSVESLLRQTGYLSVNRLAVYHTLSEMFATLKHNAVPSLTSEFVRVENEFHNTRLSKQDFLRLPKVKSRRHEGFIFKGTKLWNMFPSDLKNVQRKETFTTKIKDWIQEHIPI